MEGADLSHCSGEKTEDQERTGEKVITAWEWINPEEYLMDGMLALPGAGRRDGDHPDGLGVCILSGGKGLLLMR